jgi:hypothetical protein
MQIGNITATINKECKNQSAFRASRAAKTTQPPCLPDVVQIGKAKINLQQIKIISATAPSSLVPISPYL